MPIAFSGGGDGGTAKAAHDLALRAIEDAHAADDRAANAQMMVKNRDAKLEQAATDAASAVQKYTSLDELASAYTAAVTASVQDRQALHEEVAALSRALAAIQLTPGKDGKNGSDAAATVVTGGSVAVPALVLGIPVDLPITLNGTMTTATYRVTPVYGSLLGKVTVIVKSRTTTSLVVTVTSSLAVAVGQSITVICS